jgi:nucleotide-binding universal stress UspA family protein
MNTIVVGIDGSEPSRRALEWAADEARLRNARLRVVHSWFEVLVGLYAAPVVYEQIAAEEIAQERLDKAVASIPDGSPELLVEPVLVHDRAESVLVHESEGADLLVVGSRGRGSVAELVLGSVSHHVLHHARCPVVVVH